MAFSHESMLGVAVRHHFVAIDCGAGASNHIDAACGILMHDAPYGAHRVTPEIGGSSAEWDILTPDQVIGGKSVKKFGRTTGLTQGFVSAINVGNVLVSYNPRPNKRIARFDGQIAIETGSTPFSEPGDSGSLIFSEDDRPVALLFAGSPRGGMNGRGITFANPIASVLDQLDVDLYTGPWGACDGCRQSEIARHKRGCSRG